MSTIQYYKEIYSLFQSGLSDLVVEDRLKVIELKFSESSGDAILELDNPYAGMTLNVVWQQGVLNGSAVVADQSGRKIYPVNAHADRNRHPAGTPRYCDSVKWRAQCVPPGCHPAHRVRGSTEWRVCPVTTD